MKIKCEHKELVETIVSTFTKILHFLKVNDALLHAISEEYVEAVEMLLYHEETTHKPGDPYV